MTINISRFYILLSCAMLLVCLSACLQEPAPVLHPLKRNSEMQRIQTQNVTSAIPGMGNDANAIDSESAIELSRRINKNPLGQHGNYNNEIETITTTELPNVSAEQASTEVTTKEQQITNALNNLLTDDPLSEAPALVNIGLLLPITGKASSTARSLQNAAELAVLDAKERGQNIKLLPFDTRGTPQGAQIAFGRAASKDVDIIIGPLLRENARSIATLAHDKNIPVLSFSNDTELTEDGIYVLGHDPVEQIQRTINYAYAQGIRKFSALLPQSDYGKMIEMAIIDTLKRKNARSYKIEYYSGANENLSRTIQRLTFVDPTLPKPAAQSEALIVPEGGRMLHTLVARLYRRGIDSDHIRLIGSGSWDNDVTISEPRLTGSIFASVSPIKKKEFKKNFRSNFGYDPVGITSLGYDGVIAAATLATRGEDGFTHESITDPMGFVSADNLFRLNDKGYAERSLAIIEVNRGKRVMLEPAPTLFPSTLR